MEKINNLIGPIFKKRSLGVASFSTLLIKRYLRPTTYYLLLTTSCLLFTVPLAQGATFYFSESKVGAGVGDSFRVEVLMDSPENVNAVEGVIKFPGEMLEVKSINDGNSVISLWIQRPELVPTPAGRDSDQSVGVSGQISFSGAIPGGFPSQKGKLFSVDFKVKKAGNGSVSIGGLSALLNDGQGSSATIAVKNINLNFSKTPTGASVSAVSDTIPPENFPVTVTSDSNIFDGKHFVSFTTQDKGSGVARYEVTEQRSLLFRPKPENWETAQGSYVLKDQELKSWIGIRAIDWNGNQREIWTIPARTIFYRYLLTILGGIIAVIVVALWVVVRRKQKVASSK